jgi:hypothetical protein
LTRLDGARGLDGGREARADREDGHARALGDALGQGLDDAALADRQRLALLGHLLDVRVRVRVKVRVRVRVRVRVSRAPSRCWG